MLRLSRQGVIVGSVLLVGTAAAALLALSSRARIVEAGFWFERVAHESSELGELTALDMATIESVAFSEITRAFAGLRIAFSDRRDATYRVRVVQELRDLRFRRQVEVAGASRAIAGLGGQGEVSFGFLAASAIGYAPPGADRDAILAAIGRGVGRAAVHEFAHQLLPTAPIHSSDIHSYEYGSAQRAAQFYGELHWDIAGPLLHQRLASPAAARVSPRHDRRSQAESLWLSAAGLRRSAENPGIESPRARNRQRQVN